MQDNSLSLMRVVDYYVPILTLASIEEEGVLRVLEWTNTSLCYTCYSKASYHTYIHFIFIIILPTGECVIVHAQRVRLQDLLA